jgi:hypothetical protein
MLKQISNVFLFIMSGISFVLAQSCGSIDAVSSASTRFKVVAGSEYCDTLAKIAWQDYYSNGTRYFEWGTSTSYGQKSTLSGKSGTTILPNLLPNTKYYWRANRLYNGKNPLTPAGTFTTKPKAITGVIQQNSFQNSGSNQQQNIIVAGRTLLHLSSRNNDEVTISFYSMNGKLISKTELKRAENITQIPMEHFKTGAYVCIINSRSTILNHSIVIK